jgi:hypothetical protein
VTTGDARGEAYYYYFTTTIATYFQFFPNKPLCLTEVGYFVAGETAPDGYDWAAETTAELRGEWLAEAARIAQRLGRVRLFTVYNIDAEISAENDPQGNYAILGADDSCSACESLSEVVQVG